MVTHRSSFAKSVASWSQGLWSLQGLTLIEESPFSNHPLADLWFLTLFHAASHFLYFSYSLPAELPHSSLDGHRNLLFPLDRSTSCETMTDHLIYRRLTRGTDWLRCRLLCALSPPLWSWSLLSSSWICETSSSARPPFCPRNLNRASLCTTGTVTTLFLTIILLNSNISASLSRLSFAQSWCSLNSTSISY